MSDQNAGTPGEPHAHAPDDDELDDGALDLVVGGLDRPWFPLDDEPSTSAAPGTSGTILAPRP